MVVLPPCYRSPMRRYADEGDPGSTLASFGEARLMQYLDTRVELVGGTEAERKTALDWLTRFLPEARLGQPKPLLWAGKGRERR